MKNEALSMETMQVVKHSLPSVEKYTSYLKLNFTTNWHVASSYLYSQAVIHMHSEISYCNSYYDRYTWFKSMHAVLSIANLNDIVDIMYGLTYNQCMVQCGLSKWVRWVYYPYTVSYKMTVSWGGGATFFGNASIMTYEFFPRILINLIQLKFTHS